MNETGDFDNVLQTAPYYDNNIVKVLPKIESLHHSSVISFYIAHWVWKCYEKILLLQAK